MANEYCTLASVKSRLDIATLTTTYDAELNSVIEAVSRAIDARLRRRFFVATETRYYTANCGDWVIIDDCQSVSALATDDNGDGTYETDWAASDYILQPSNAITDGAPYCDIIINPNGDQTFPLHVPNGVKITGSFGYSDGAPPAIEEACILASMRVWKRRDVLFGTAGSADLGTYQAITSILNDGELRMMLESISVRVV